MAWRCSWKNRKFQGNPCAVDTFDDDTNKTRNNHVLSDIFRYAVFLVVLCAMNIMSLQKIAIAFGGPPVLDDVTFSVEKGDRACITGRNGEGKSTLLKIMAGILEPDHGEIATAPNLRIAYLSQDVPGDRQGSAETACEHELHNARNVSRVREFLTRLGVNPEQPFNSLSGGQRRRALLAAELAAEPDLLLLDEPTNHLDIETIEWLEEYLAKSLLTCVFITHDRAFLRRTARRVFDLDRGRLSGWNCDYETFLRRKADLLAEEEVANRRKEKRLAAEESWLVHGVTARRSRNMGRVAGLKALRQELAERRQSIGTAKMSLNTVLVGGEIVAKAKDVTFQYPGAERPIVKDFNAIVLRKDRIGIIGPNGSGKTTLLRILLQQLQPQSGSVELGARASVSFLDQLRTTLDPDKSVAENVADGHDQVVINGVTRHVLGYLQDFLFSPDRARTPVRALSGGERARLLLAKLFLAPGNILVMDEPTNDLDMETLEILEDLLLNYPGTLLLVSHDRAFLDQVVTSSFVLLGDGSVYTCPGGYADWQREKPNVLAALGKVQSSAPKDASAPVSKASPQNQTKVSQRKLGFNEKRELERLPAEIERLEKQIADLEQRLSDGRYFVTNPTEAQTDAALLPQQKAELEQKLERWMMLEELKG